MDDDIKGKGSGSALLVERSEVALGKPPMYQVLLINDDYTPMGFVIEVLEQFFSMSSEAAMRVMLAVHHHGKAICGVYTRDIAETKMVQVNNFSIQHEHPLQCLIELVG
jgi:ATP-dependent Clp protease adaptor protein ClpS